jgi:hypothetical protein
MKKISSFLIAFLLLSCGNRQSEKSINLIPETASLTPSYWCTWGTQNYASDSTTLKNAVWGVNGHFNQANLLTQEAVFGENGWAHFIPEVSKDLYIMFDVGWDIPSGINFNDSRWMLGSLELAEDKFPDCTGTPAERLKKLNQMCIDHGWKGAGIWVAAHPAVKNPAENMTRQEIEDYYRERFNWSREAGIEYWKVDYGTFGDEHWFRKMLSDLSRETNSGVVVENARNSAPTNDYECPWDIDIYHETGKFVEWGNGSVLEKTTKMIGYSDAFRTYDVTAHLSIPTTLDRAAQQLAVSSKVKENNCILNTEDEMYIGAALGCAIGIMRHPQWMELNGNNYDPFDARKRIIEIVRAVRWQRIAPAFGVGAAPVQLDENYLTDSWQFEKGDTWASWFDGKEVQQKAPARVARGMGLPDVVSEGDVPYVIASRHPNGAVAVATLPRVSPHSSLHHPEAEVTLNDLEADFPIGVFGKYKNLILNFKNLPENTSVYAQDLALDKAINITQDIEIQNNRLIISGELIEKIGTEANRTDDLSEPGLVLKIK